MIQYSRYVHATLDEGLCELAHNLRLRCILHEVADTRVACWKGVSVDKGCFATTVN